MNFIDGFKKVLTSEANSILRLVDLVNEQAVNNMVEVYSFLLSNGGKLVISGVGKSGLIGEKIASTFSSLGLTSIFLHPTEALHGDLGRINDNDAIVFLSKSGSTEEIMKMIPYLKIPKSRMIGLLGDTKSVIADKCGIVFDCSVESEACINNLAPTNSSTAALAMGDALSVLYETYTGLSKEKYAVFHPGGLLGKSLSLKVKDVMIAWSECPRVQEESNLQDVILEMTSKNYGLCFVIDSNEEFKGIIVEGDIRRAFAKSNKALDSKATEIMNSSPVVIDEDKLAYDALKLMESEDRKISVLPVLAGKKINGLIRLHDILKEGFPSVK